MTLTFDNVSFFYKNGEQPILDNLSFEVSHGDRMALKGPSGSGKSTIFRLLMAFEQPDNGQIKVNNEPLSVKMVSDLRHQTSWLPQDLDLGEGIVKELFYYPFEFKVNTNKYPSEEIVLETFTALGLPQKSWQEKFEDLSTGQRQRIGIALCHHLKKPVMLLDEPTSALDDESKEKVKELLFADKERLILSTSHDPWWINQCKQVIDLDK